MKSPITKQFSTAIAFLLSLFFHLASTVPLTILTNPLIELVNASHLTPILFPSLNVTSLNAIHFDPICAPSDDDEAWCNEPVRQRWRYDATCYEAMRLFSKEVGRHGVEEFEYLAPEAKATTQLKTMQTPRRYTVGGSGFNPSPSCTVIVAMLNFASPGQLPQQPPRPFPPTDVSSFDDLVDAGGEVLMGCIRARGTGILPDLHFGWVQAGRGGNIGVFFTGTKSQIDRSIPRGVHP